LRPVARSEEAAENAVSPLSQSAPAMRLVLISNYVPDRQESMLRYAQMLRRVLAGRVDEVRVVHPPLVVGKLAFLPKQFSYIDKYLMGPWWLRWQCRGADVVHVCDHTNAMYLRCAGEAPSLITCHDLIALRASRGELRYGEAKRSTKILQEWIARSLSRARLVVCDSAATEKDLLRLTPGPGMKTQVVYLPLNRDYAPAAPDRVQAVRARLGLGAETPYFFHIGGNEPYKNRLGVLRIFAELKKFPQFHGTKVVLAGRPWTEPVHALARSLNLVDSAIGPGFISDDELEALYSGALALLYPSLIEGYGWPPLEAQACGCPVITTKRGSLAEVAGDAAIIVDPEDAAGAAATIAEQWPRREEFRQAGFRNLERFRADDFAEAMFAIYQEVSASRAARSR
jgi:glycosyltransferase involved in cell wall biosynthesis